MGTTIYVEIVHTKFNSQFDTVIGLCFFRYRLFFTQLSFFHSIELIDAVPVVWCGRPDLFLLCPGFDSVAAELLVEKPSSE